MSVRSLIVRVGIAVLVMGLALFGVFRVIERPVPGHTDAYTALFTDANGLRIGDDVRLYGVRVGKIGSVGLNGALARVGFTVQHDHPLFADSKIAVKYQNLTGFRYLEIQQPASPGARRNPATVFATTDTIPAFDITTLFKGLRPVLAELSPDDLNSLSTNLLAVVQGDGTDVGPALQAIDTLSHYAADRQAVMSTLLANLSEVSSHLGGKSGEAVRMLANLTNLFTNITDKLPGLVQFSIGIPPVLQPVRDMLTVAGLSGTPHRDLDALLQNAFPDREEAAAVFAKLPGVIQTIAATLPPTGPEAQMNCAHGIAVAPDPVRVLFAGQRIILCHR